MPRIVSDAHHRAGHALCHAAGAGPGSRCALRTTNSETANAGLG